MTIEKKQNDECKMINNRMRVFLFPEDGFMSELWLPSAIEGRYQFDRNDEIQNQIWIEALDGVWNVCYSSAVVVIENENSVSTNLSNHCIFQISYNEQKYTLYAELVNERTMLFHNYQIEKIDSISIGSSDNNDIVCFNPVVSSHHAEIYFINDSLHVKDISTSNGIYVNGKKTSNQILDIGDSICILGIKILIGPKCIAINDENNLIVIKSQNITRITVTKKSEVLQNNSEEKLFNRLPRTRTALEKKCIELEAPPMSLSSNKIPLVLRMGGSMVMGGSSALAGNYTTLLSAVLFPVLTQKYSDKERKEYELRRSEKYKEYLRQKREEIQHEKAFEQRILIQNYPELGRVLMYPNDGEHLWERRKTDDDFLHIRVGVGQMPMLAELNYPEHKFDIDDDPLEDDMYSLAESPMQLENVPMLVNLIENFVSGVTGPKQQTFSLIKRLIMMISILHSYDEVKMVFLAEKKDISDFEFVKYLPHFWDDQKSRRFIATNTSEAYQISEYIKQEVEADIEKPREFKDILKTRPYYVVFAISKTIFDSMEVLKDIMQQEATCGVSVVTAFDDVPKDCTLMFKMSSFGSNSIAYLKQIDREDDLFTLDRFDASVASMSMKKIANTSLKIITQAYSLPKTVTFLEMFGVGRVEHLNPIKRWSDSNPVKSLSTPIGVATDGSVFELDLHQKYQGSHGLVAGMTGSGKSEFLLTYILSMAVNYHPDEVAFVLIDYKGGGLANAFDDKEKGIHLPHLVGTITNLDGSTIQRSLISLNSEVVRRQKIFKEVKGLSDEGTMDIYLYQRMYRNRIVKEPLPHLFIISDEFAELKHQEPTFMDELISIARIGRSLGIHLVLATQKPSGVVNEQIKSNTKFKVCLKVQDKSDSTEMLGRPEAAELRETGRFYLQVGYNEFFALGQSAWSGAPYEPCDEVVVQQDNSLSFIDSVGQSLIEVRPKEQKNNTCGSQLVAVINLLSSVALQHGISPKSLWQPELKKKIDVDEYSGIYGDAPRESEVKVCIGVLDDPENQEQFPLIIDLSHSKNLLIVGNTGSGKTSLIQTILYSITMHYQVEDVNYYILDYSSRMLKLFRAAPHCGAVLCEEDEDSIDTFFELINSIVAERKKLFSKLEVDSFEKACAIQKIPLILVFIDNYIVLSSSKKGESHSYKLQNYLKDSSPYGVKYIISVSHLNEISGRIKQELGDRVAIALKDKYDYIEAIGSNVSYVPKALPGKGLYNYDGRPLEIQTVMFGASLDEKERLQKLKTEIQSRFPSDGSYVHAKRLPVLDENATYEDFSEQFLKGRIPLGFSKSNNKPVALPLRQFASLSLYFGNPTGREKIISNFMYAAYRENMELWVVKQAEDSFFSHNDESRSESMSRYLSEAKTFEPSFESLELLWRTLSKEITARNNAIIEYCNTNGFDISDEDTFDHTFKYLRDETVPILLFIENFVDFCLNSDSTATMIFDRIFQVAHKRNVYAIGCFYPSDEEKISYNLLYSSFPQDDRIMFFGGQLHKQTLSSVTFDETSGNKIWQSNVCLMLYNKKFYPLLMPCGELDEISIDEDKESIF